MDIKSRLLSVAVEAARSAGNIISKGLNKRKFVKFKGRIDPVTHIDTKCEGTIVKIIKGNFPDHTIISEEIGIIKKKSDYSWFIDPLDGTVNYSHGFPSFCVCIGVVFKGRVVVGVIYDPNKNELFTAVEGRGAYINGRRMMVSKISDLEKALVATGFAYNIKEARNKNFRSFSRAALHCQGVRRAGSAGLDLAYVACGRLDGFWEYNLQSWDVAAGSLMVTEAGGCVSNIKDKKLDLFSKQIIATNKHIYKDFISILAGSNHNS
ncbi:MAG: inositol monophosphatase family protein [bacterium]